MSVSQAYNFKQVSDQFDTAGVVAEAQLKCLKDEGYSAVVNLLPDDSDYAVVNERQIVESQGVNYYYIPVDFSAPAYSDYIEFASVMKSLPKGKSLIHCAANYRVSAFFSVYAFQNLGWSSLDARNFIATIWDMSEHPVWESFVAQGLFGKDS